MVRLILGSSSPARLMVLRNAGLNPEVLVSDVDESTATSQKVPDLVAELATMKGEAVLAKLPLDTSETTVLVAADTLLEMDGAAQGKPGSEDAAVQRLLRMRGGSGVLYTGHYVAVIRDGAVRKQVRVAATEVFFADMSDAEIIAYAASGEPERVAGSFTIDGLGSAFITGIKGPDNGPGDTTNVIGLSLPLFRQMLIDLGIPWPELWVQTNAG
jgi:septum formation protein